MGRIVRTRHPDGEDVSGEVVAYTLTPNACHLLILKQDGTLVRAESDWVVVVSPENYTPPAPTSTPPPADKRGSLLKRKA